MSATRRTGRFKLALALLAGLGGLFVAAFVGFVVAFDLYRVTSASMAPTLLVGEHVLVRAWGAPRVGDVVAFRHPKDRGTVHLKRVVAVGGQRVAVEDNRVVLDGTPQPMSDPVAAVVVDDTCRTADTRSAVEHLAGVAHPVLLQPRPGVLADAPAQVVPGDAVFLLGDHRDASEDSRRFGPVPLELVEGVVVARLFSLDPCTGGPRPGRSFQRP